MKTHEEIAAEARPALEAKHGQVWNTAELQADYDVVGFCAPYVVVRRKADDKMGSLQFYHAPRFYYGWTEDK
mgnify:CR=1 FL=1